MGRDSKGLSVVTPETSNSCRHRLLKDVCGIVLPAYTCFIDSHGNPLFQKDVPSRTPPGAILSQVSKKYSVKHSSDIGLELILIHSRTFNICGEVYSLTFAGKPVASRYSRRIKSTKV